MANQKPKKITIMGLLAECSTNDARNLLKKYGMPPAKNKAELELALANLYKNCDDKKQLEKDFAEIHPHKDFMKKYLTPKEPIKSELVIEDIKTEEVKMPLETAIQPNLPIMPEQQSNCNGSCACGCSSFSGVDQLKMADKTGSIDKDKIIVYGMFGIVSILALVLISQQIKK